MRAQLTEDVSVKGGEVPPLSSRRVETKASRFPTGATDVPLRLLQEALLSPWQVLVSVSVAAPSMCLLFPPDST